MTSSAGATRSAIAALCACATAATLVSAAAQGQQFKSGTDLVRLSAVVTGRDGLLVRGLTPAAFEVLEDGVKQTVSAFAEGGQEEIPLHAGLLVDRSGSMELDLREATNAAIQFVNALDEALDVTFVDFNSSIRIGRFEPQSYPHLFERMRDQNAEGMTALWDAVAAYLRNAFGANGPARARDVHGRWRQHEPDAVRPAAHDASCGQRNGLRHRLSGKPVERVANQPARCT
jgi:hypothetical protein